jgi:amidase
MKTTEDREREELRMNRREFVGGASLAGAAALAAGAGCAMPESKPGLGAEGAGAGFNIEAFELEELGIGDLQKGMESGQLSARSIAERYLERIEAVDRQGPSLRSILEINPEALAIADGLDREREQAQVRGPLHGVPVLLKDNIATADRMTTTAGSYALEGCIPPRDSFVAARLREAGAVLLAKTNLSEWANFRSEQSSSGWSGRGGPCRTPYILDRNPCGSSSGSGAAISANLGAVSLGTETDGSVVCPSNANGLVGIKPPLGLVSRSGIVPIAHSQDTAGPMTRTVTDGALLLGALTGIDPRDEATAASEARAHSDYTEFLDPQGLEGARIGVGRQLFGFHPKVDAVLEEALAAIKDQGAELIDPVEFVNISDFGDAEYAVLLYEFKADLNRYLAELGEAAPVATLADIIRFNEEHASLELPFFGQEIFLEAEEKGDLSTPEYLEALEKCRRLTRDEGIDSVMDQHRLDAIVAPTGGPAWTTDLVNGDHFGGSSSSLAAVAGYPNITVPAGFVHGLPIGLSFFGRAWSEPTLIRFTFAFEQATRIRRPPEFLPTLPT